MKLLYKPTSHLDTTRHVRLVEPLHFGCFELIKQHGSTRWSRRARHVEHVVSCRDVTWQPIGIWAITAVIWSAEHFVTRTKRSPDVMTGETPHHATAYIENTLKCTGEQILPKPGVLVRGRVVRSAQGKNWTSPPVLPSPFLSHPHPSLPFFPSYLPSSPFLPSP